MCTMLTSTSGVLFLLVVSLPKLFFFNLLQGVVLAREDRESEKAPLRETATLQSHFLFSSQDSGPTPRLFFKLLGPDADSPLGPVMQPP